MLTSAADYVFWQGRMSFWDAQMLKVTFDQLPE
jgi:hypothetical protein